MGTFNEKIKLVKKAHKKNTINQLKKWGVKLNKNRSFLVFIRYRNISRSKIAYNLTISMLEAKYLTF